MFIVFVYIIYIYIHIYTIYVYILDLVLPYFGFLCSKCVRMYRSFQYRGHLCIAFEKLGSSLYDIIKINGHKGFPIDYVKEFALQIFQGAYLHLLIFVIQNHRMKRSYSCD